MRTLVISLCITLAHGVAAAQIKGDKRLAALLLSADSVVIVGHEETLGYNIDPDQPVPPPLMVDGRPNRSIIRQSRRLPDTAIRRLAGIVGEMNTNRSRSAESCFAPEHAIFIYGKGRISYVNLCFGCGHCETTANIDFSLDNDSYDSRWDKMEMFFREQGVTYDLDDDSLD